MIEFTMESVMNHLREAVAEKGEGFVYNEPVPGQGCCYVHGTEKVFEDWGNHNEPIFFEKVMSDLTPGCLVGSALIRGGLDPQSFIDLEINLETGARAAIEELAEKGKIRFPSDREMDDVIGVLAVAQDEQDNQYTWGRALQGAEERFEEIRKMRKR